MLRKVLPASVFLNVILCIVFCSTQNKGISIANSSETARPVQEIPEKTIYANLGDSNDTEQFKKTIWIIGMTETRMGADKRCLVEKPVTKELGVLQVTPIVVRDCNRILGCNKFSLQDRSNLSKSIDMLRITTQYYYPTGTIEQHCRLWNRGANRKRQWDSYGDYYWGMAKEFYKKIL